MPTLFELYKPLRNLLRQCALEDSLEDVWRLSNGAAALSSKQSLQSVSRIPVQPWELPALTRELLLHAGPTGRKRLGSPDTLATAIRHLRALSSEATKLRMPDDKELFNELLRIEHQQFPWQPENIYSALTRCLKIFGSSEVAPLLETKTGLTTRAFFFLGFAVAGHLAGRHDVNSDQDYNAFGIDRATTKLFFDRVAAHGYQRATTDIDLMVAPTVDAGVRMKAALMVLPEQAAKDIDPEWFPEGENIRVGDDIIVDIMLNANGQTFDTLKQYAQLIDVDGVAVRTVSLEGLLLTKRTMREKDHADCAVIERALAAMKGSSLATQWNAQPGQQQEVGRIVAMSDSEVVQDAGRGRHVVWDRRTLRDSQLNVGESVAIKPDGKVTRRQPGNDLGR